MRPRISIVIPVYNQVATIAEAINSALRQVVRAHEVIVSENYSTDGTAEVIASYGSQIKVIKPDKHLSMVENWNFAVAASSGDWIGMCSGDDLLADIYIDEFSRIIDENTGAVFAMGGWRELNEASGGLITRRLNSVGRLTVFPDTVASQLFGPKASFAAFCFRKSVFVMMGGFDAHYKYNMDWVLQYRMAFYGKFVKSNRCVACYRVQSRPELEAKRVAGYIEDKCRFVLDLIPLSKSAGVSSFSLACVRVYHYCDVLELMDSYALRPDSTLRSLLVKLEDVCVWGGVLRRNIPMRRVIFGVVKIIKSGMSLRTRFRF